MKNQKITRKNLKEIYKSDIGCWKEKVGNILIDSEDVNIEISNELILKAYEEANSAQKKIIEKYFKIIKEEDICDKIKDLNSVYKILGISEKDFLPYQKKRLSDFEEKMNNIARLEKVAECYNQYWTVKFDGNQRNYYPWFDCDSGVWRVSSGAFYVYDCSNGSLVYFKNEKIALDAGNKFLWLYKLILNM